MKITKTRLKEMIKEEVDALEEVYLPGDKTEKEEQLRNAMYTWVIHNNLQMSTRHMQEFVLNLLKDVADQARSR